MGRPASEPPEDLLALAARLVAIPSVSRDEGGIADFVEAELRALRGLETVRVGANVVARTGAPGARRLLLAGHLDTVPPAGNQEPVVDGDRLSGVGAADMKGGLAVMLALAKSAAAAPAEMGLALTWVFYACEEVDRRESGLAALSQARPDLLEADAAALLEPTGAVVEAGCQGTMRLALTLAGRRAHTARPWMGINAAHRLAPVLAAACAYEARRPVLDGCEYREALQVVRVAAGVANNVVPDSATLVLNHRFAPDRGAEQARRSVLEALGQALDLHGQDSVVVEDVAEGALPSLGHPLLAALVGLTRMPPRAKLGWTDVAFFSARGVPALNFGPGDPELAHAPSEHVDRSQLEDVYRALAALVRRGEG